MSKVMAQDGAHLTKRLERRVRDFLAEHGLAEAGSPIVAEYRGIRSGHQMNVRLLEILAEQPDRWEFVTAVAQAQAV